MSNKRHPSEKEYNNPKQMMDAEPPTQEGKETDIRTTGKLRETRATGEQPAAGTGTTDPFHQHTETFRQRRNEWANTAVRIFHHSSGWPKAIDLRTGQKSYSFLGAGLEAIMQQDPGIIEWNESLEGEDGRTVQTVDDTTMTVCDYYGLSVEVVDTLDELDDEGLGIRELNQKMQEADHCFIVEQGGRPRLVERQAPRSAG